MKILLVSPDPVDAEIVQRVLEDHQVEVCQELIKGREAYRVNTYDLVIIGPSSYNWCIWADELMNFGQGVVMLINLGGWGRIPVISFLNDQTSDPDLYLQYAKPVVAT